MPRPFQGKYLESIYEWFFARILTLRPDRHTLDEWKDEVFGAKERSITTCRAKRAFRIPGLFQAASRVLIQGAGNRQAKRGDILYVREDTRTPDVVEVERQVGHKFWTHEKAFRATNTFTLTRQEWNSIAANLEEVVETYEPDSEI